MVSILLFSVLLFYSCLSRGIFFLFSPFYHYFSFFFSILAFLALFRLFCSCLSSAIFLFSEQFFIFRIYSSLSSAIFLFSFLFLPCLAIFHACKVNQTGVLTHRIYLCICNFYSLLNISSTKLRIPKRIRQIFHTLYR